MFLFKYLWLMVELLEYNSKTDLCIYHSFAKAK